MIMKVGGRKIPRRFEKWVDFQFYIYIIDNVAENVETGEMLVIYHKMGEDKILAQSLESFMSVVDVKKYPNVSAEYMFSKFTVIGAE